MIIDIGYPYNKYKKKNESELVWLKFLKCKPRTLFLSQLFSFFLRPHPTHSPIVLRTHVFPFVIFLLLWQNKSKRQNYWGVHATLYSCVVLGPFAFSDLFLNHWIIKDDGMWCTTVHATQHTHGPVSSNGPKSTSINLL